MTGSWIILAKALPWTESWTRWCCSLQAWTCIWCCRAVGYQYNLLINRCGTSLQFWPFPGCWYRMREWFAVLNYIYFQNTWLSPMVCSVPWKKSNNRRKRDTFVPYVLMQLQALQHFSSHKSWFCAGILPLSILQPLFSTPSSELGKIYFYEQNLKRKSEVATCLKVQEIKPH